MSDNEALPESFVDQVKEALEKLYDFQALQESNLISLVEAQRSDSPTSSAHQLRKLLVEAIESLNPGKEVTVQSGTVRIYNLVYMHYVGRLTIQQAAWEVGVSLRQAYRDLRRGQEVVSAILWHKLNENPLTHHDISVSAELLRLSESTTCITLQEVLESAVRPIQILAEKYNIVIHLDAPANAVTQTTNLIIAQQILTHILSQIIQQISPPEIHIHLFEDKNFLRIQFAARAQTTLLIKSVIQQMMKQIGWELEYFPIEEVQEIRLKVYNRSTLILLIDDNEGLVHLLQRYLMDDAYTVTAVPNTETGLQMIHQLKPDAIILDVMMPGMDGWELLQRLKIDQETRLIPVIICSIINDPELAFALGASHYVPKPVTQQSLRLALKQLHL